mmetsp:Transcript_22341/g.76514  ORF Transcript_22341/g.76514 Transcript_22341/m.76514 type:complete len:205 (+) Transcript_22341:1261-1875(+)
MFRRGHRIVYAPDRIETQDCLQVALLCEAGQDLQQCRLLLRPLQPLPGQRLQHAGDAEDRLEDTATQDMHILVRMRPHDAVQQRDHVIFVMPQHCGCARVSFNQTDQRLCRRSLKGNVALVRLQGGNHDSDSSCGLCVVCICDLHIQHGSDDAQGVCGQPGIVRKALPRSLRQCSQLLPLWPTDVLCRPERFAPAWCQRAPSRR